MPNHGTSGGLWIPPEVLNHGKLSIQEKFIVAKIINLGKTGECFAGNLYFGKFLKVTADRAGRIISDLVKKGCLSTYIDKSKGCRRQISVNTNYLSEACGENNVPLGENTDTLSVFSTPTNGENTVYNKELNKNINIINKNFKNYEFRNTKSVQQCVPDYSKKLRHV